ncbi:hypothetical protein Ahy_B08g092606 [Arachis hypogaea]|uniref:Uncharacterized protein n=1 Tax=Arachis hypogaea TaxID=3818 RepID=A0A444Y4C0_ARAHY|nr:hypothetical protein Ahy_B08g092606 [Arachis hypogaea]
MAIFGREPVLSGNSKSYIKLGWVQRIRDAEPLDTEESIRRYVESFGRDHSVVIEDRSEI